MFLSKSFYFDAYLLIRDCGSVHIPVRFSSPSGSFLPGSLIVSAGKFLLFLPYIPILSLYSERKRSARCAVNVRSSSAVCAVQSLMCVCTIRSEHRRVYPDPDPPHGPSAPLLHLTRQCPPGKEKTLFKYLIQAYIYCDKSR